MKESQIICPYCLAPYTKEMLEVYEESYGCDTGCTTISIDITCENCKRLVYVKEGFGSLGPFNTAEDYKNNLVQLDIDEAKNDTP